MSCGIYARPKNKQGKRVASGSNLHTKLENIFGRFPATLTHKDLEKLETMQYCGEDVGDIIDYLYNSEEIELTAEY